MVLGELNSHCCSIGQGRLFWRMNDLHQLGQLQQQRQRPAATVMEVEPITETAAMRDPSRNWLGCAGVDRRWIRWRFRSGSTGQLMILPDLDI